MKSVCNDCRHVIKKDTEITPMGGIVKVKVSQPSCLWECGKTVIYSGGHVDHISGYVTQPKYEKCLKVNIDGKCTMFEPIPSLRTGLAWIINSISDCFRRAS